MRLMREPRYETNLFADISALTQLNRGQRILEAVLTREWLHPRLVNGSDYPLPALRIIYSTRLLEWSGFLDARARRLCNRLANINPLLFDFALKRSLRVERDDGVFRFPNRVFETAWLFATPPSSSPPG
jgi:mannonate dehydratase